jgi:DNA-binding response OmpR family regulator
MKKILIVEDHELLRMTFTHYTQQAVPNSLVCAVGTIEQGIEFIRTNRADVILVITDWHLPDGLGKTMIDTAQSQSIPSILTSSCNEPLNHGAHLFIPKMKFDERIEGAIQQLLQT